MTTNDKSGIGPFSSAGGGKGKKGGRFAAGAGGYCRCPACGATMAHQRGVPCFERVCSKCGAKMTRGQL
jgi:hypothetical protein